MWWSWTGPVVGQWLRGKARVSARVKERASASAWFARLIDRHVLAIWAAMVPALPLVVEERGPGSTRTGRNDR